MDPEKEHRHVPGDSLYMVACAVLTTRGFVCIGVDWVSSQTQWVHL